MIEKLDWGDGKSYGTSPMQKLVEAVQTYAREHYNEGGWDYVVECWDSSDIEEEVSSATSAEEAIEIMRKIVSVRDDIRRDIQAEAF